MAKIAKVFFDVKKVTDNSDQLRKAIAALTGFDLVIGYPEESARTEGGPTNASLAFIHNQGSPAQNIPPRPYLDPGVRSAQDRLGEQLKKAGQLALDGRPDATKQALEGAGLIAQAAVRAYMTTANFTPLQPSTLRRRKAAGFEGERPLLVTGQLRAGVSYALRAKTPRRVPEGTF